MTLYGIIMAGGSGRRFWPLSRDKSPKQFLPQNGDRSMFQATFDRLLPIIDKSNILTIVTRGQGKWVRASAPSLPKENIIEEPMGKDTALCVGLGAILCRHRDPEGIQIVIPADHLIIDEVQFRETLLLGARVAEETGSIVTIGIPPRRPETGYGYIQYAIEPIPQYPQSIHKVVTFAEKPNVTTAQRFLKSGDFLWNSGIFIWKVSTILHEFERSLPEIYEGLVEIERNLDSKKVKTVIKRVYSQSKSISVDYGIMEKTANVCVIKSDFGWSDMGSWEEIYRLGSQDEQGNVVRGANILHESFNNLIYGNKRLIAAVGVENYVIVDTQDVLLICRRDRTQEVKEIVEGLKRKNYKQYL